ncbi:MAG TPA: hypothetical protein VHY84_26055 [Bryobacteraceae bacterium]|jgi:hypothetical protein|nr:hypothetical protein [Bryobacteraceae bacterium]
MYKAMNWVVLVLIITPLSQGQQRREAGHVDDPSVSDVAHFTVTVAREYDSIPPLYSDSDLVVQATVSTVFPARDLSLSNRSHTLVTDILLNVKRTFKGPTLTELAVVQLGGTLGKMQRIPDQFRMMQNGEQYVLFLKQDPRMQSVALAGTVTYSVTGGYAGIFQLVNNTLQLSPAAHINLRDRYQGKLPDVLLADLGNLSH